MTNGGQLVREFILRNNEDAALLYAFLKANREPMNEQGRALRVVVSEYKAKRRDEQNAAMWAGILKPTSEQAWTRGQRLTDKGWNLVLKIMFLPEVNSRGMKKWFYVPGTEDRELMMSTSDLNVSEMATYMNEISAYVTTDLGVMLPANPNQERS